MNLESEHFIIRDIRDTDRENVRRLELTRPWTRAMATVNGGINNYFESVWNDYCEEGLCWIIERRGIFCGDIQLDIEDNESAQFYIQLFDSANVTGFGIELFDELLQYIHENMGISVFYIETWDEDDLSKEIYTEAGYEMEGNNLEIRL